MQHKKQLIFKHLYTLLTKPFRCFPFPFSPSLLFQVILKFLPHKYHQTATLSVVVMTVIGGSESDDFPADTGLFWSIQLSIPHSTKKIVALLVITILLAQVIVQKIKQSNSINCTTE